MCMSNDLDFEHDLVIFIALDTFHACLHSKSRENQTRPTNLGTTLAVPAVAMFCQGRVSDVKCCKQDQILNTKT